MTGKHKRPGRCQRGVAAVEAAVLMPVMLLMILGFFEVYQYYRTVSVMDRVAFTVANGVAMQRELFNEGQCTRSDDICVYGTIAQDLFQPLDYARNGGMTITAYVATEAKNGPVSWDIAQHAWRKEFKGTSATDVDTTSKLIDSSLFPPARVNDTIIVTEVFYDYEPFLMSSKLWASLAGTAHMYSRFFFRPRFDDLREFSHHD